LWGGFCLTSGGCGYLISRIRLIMPEIRIGSTISRLSMLSIDTWVRADKKIPANKVREKTESPPVTT